MSEDKAIDKIKKLLALQDSAQKLGNVEEAANAADKVKRILLKYNLDQDVISQVENPIIIHSTPLTQFGFNPREGDWLNGLSIALAEFFVTRPFFMRLHKDEVVLQLVGPETNITVALNAISNMASAIRHFGREAFKAQAHSYGMKKGTFLRSYYQGAINGLNRNLHLITQQREEQARQETSIDIEGSMVPMVLLNQLEIKERDEIEKYVEDNVEYQTKRKKARPADAAMYQGYKQGLKLSPQTSIGAK